MKKLLYLILLNTFASANMKMVEINTNQYILKTDGVTKIRGSSLSGAAHKQAIDSSDIISYEKVIASISGCSNFFILSVTMGDNSKTIRFFINCEDDK